MKTKMVAVVAINRDIQYSCLIKSHHKLLQQYLDVNNFKGKKSRTRHLDGLGSSSVNYL